MAAERGLSHSEGVLIQTPPPFFPKIEAPITSEEPKFETVDETTQWHAKYSSVSPHPHFTGNDPEGDERLRQASVRELEKRVALAEVRKIIKPEESPLDAIERALQEAKGRNHIPIKTDGSFLVLGIQPIFGEEKPANSRSLAMPAHTVVGRCLFIAGTFQTEEEAKKNRAQLAYNEFNINRSLIKGPDRNDLSELTKFFCVNLEELRESR